MLGRVIRRFGLDTYVGGSYRQVGDLVSDEQDVLVDRGVRFSPCAYAFLGGRTNELNEEGILGVHQFRTRDGDSGEGAAQVTEAILADYIDEMGAHRRLHIQGDTLWETITTSWREGRVFQFEGA